MQICENYLTNSHRNGENLDKLQSSYQDVKYKNKRNEYQGLSEYS